MVILNAIIHRDYLPNSNIKLEFFDDRFEITSPGTLLKGITIAEILKGTSKLRNPSIAKIFEMLNYIEAYGTGFKRIFDLYKKFNLEPEIIVLSNCFRVVMPNVKYDKNVGLNEIQNKIILLIKEKPNITPKEIAVLIGVTSRTIDRNISELKDKGILIKKGSKKVEYGL